jgi:hypothetical protein
VGRKMDDGYIEIGFSISIKEVMLPRHENIMNVMEMNNGVDFMIFLLSLGEVGGGGQPDYIAMKIPSRTCNDQVCREKVKETDILFDKEEFPANKEKMFASWAMMTSARHVKNAKIGTKKKKTPKKRLLP